jgi:hypothetical protein
MGMDEEAVGSGESFSAACTEEAQQRALRLASGRNSNPGSKASPILIIEPVLHNIENYEEILCT